MTEKYISIPYKKHGRGFDGCDCFGLVRLILENEYGHLLPDPFYADVSQPELNAIMIDVLKPTMEAQRVEVPRNGDIVVMIRSGFPGHVGIYVDGSVLHTTAHYGTICEKINGLRGGKVEGYYRCN